MDTINGSFYSHAPKVGDPLYTPGRDYGTVNGEPALVFHSRTRTKMVLKWKGHQYWAGRGSQAYMPTTFVVCDIEDVTPSQGALNVRLTTIMEFAAKGTDSPDYEAIDALNASKS